MLITPVIKLKRRVNEGSAMTMILSDLQHQVREAWRLAFAGDADRLATVQEGVGEIYDQNI